MLSSKGLIKSFDKLEDVPAAKRADFEAARVEEARAESSKAEAVQKMNKNELQKFLQLVVEGEQDQAEAMLKQEPELALYAGSVTDLSERTFDNITGLQYAVWALDSHMWDMILNYLPIQVAWKQIEGLETGSWVEQYGKSASWQNLIDALSLFIELGNNQQWDAATKQWCEAVGNAQQQLPIHVVNQYCYPSRSFGPCPNFSEEMQLPRSRNTDYGEWFNCEYSGGRLGDNCFAFYRGDRQLGVVPRNEAKCVYGWWDWLADAALDHRACATYLDNKTQLLSQMLSDCKAQVNELSKAGYSKLYY